DAAAEYGLTDNVYIHAFTDGRDCDPHSGKNFIQELMDHTKSSTGKIATIIGRYYAMDRDKRWERVKLAYDLIVKGIGQRSENPVQSILDAYQEGITDVVMRQII